MDSINTHLTSLSPLPFSRSSCYFSSSKSPPSFPYKSFPTKKRRRTRTKRLTSPNKPSPFNDNNGSKNTSGTKNEHDYYYRYGAENYKLVLDINQISSILPPVSNYTARFVDSATDAFDDLRTLITVDEQCRLVVSCKRSTVEFTGVVLVCGFVLVSAVRVLVGFLGWIRFGLLNKRNARGAAGGVVVRRDRSLGGREVVVAVDTVRGGAGDGGGGGERKGFSRVLDNPLSSSLGLEGLEMDDYWRRYDVLRSGRTLPKWWPEQTGGQDFAVLDRDEYQREANRLVRGWFSLDSLIACSSCWF